MPTTFTWTGMCTFIGTQGVGKSTVLRAILFFYNADTQKLGIPVEKQSYTEYYFPYSNSYIIYEVTTEQGAFCILSFKSMGRVCYRFIDSPYRMEFFVDENRTAYSGKRPYPCRPRPVRSGLLTHHLYLRRIP